jgi:tetratricopeptide (TPR) repeat protein/tRNA A-37 threonylcarbamoyl transferase component Bud32
VRLELPDDADPDVQRVRAVVESRLLGDVAPVAYIGRFALLALIGEGGMGVVYAAYDVELDRKVAIKLLRNDRDDATVRVRIVREAQAMAKLSHPNVAHVYEVGEHEGRTFIAMEFVEGKTLRAWVASGHPTWREIVAMYVQAGRGLAAAHAEGLVHRDFKPDNALVSPAGPHGDMRVRVVDFGLARADGSPEPSDARVSSPTIDALTTPLTGDGAVLGTPLYMSPEQLAGQQVDAKSDQFALCVAAYEALYGEGPFAGNTREELLANVRAGRARDAARGTHVPGWVRAILLRGLSAVPGERWPNVEALLAALSVDRSRRRARAIGVGAALLAVVAFVGATRVDRARRARACAEQGAAIAELWNDDVERRVGARLLASDSSYAATTWERVESRLDTFAERWAGAREASCVAADIDRSRAVELAQDTDECLLAQRESFGAMIEALADAQPSVVRGAAAAAARLPSPQDCLDDAKLVTRPRAAPTEIAADVEAVRRELAHAKGIGDAGLYTRGLALTQPAVERAEAIGWPSLHAEALAQLGSFARLTSELELAESSLERAVDLALRADERGLAIDAMAKLAFTTGAQRFQRDRGLWWGQLALALAEGLGDGEEVRVAAALGALAALHVANGELAQARPLYLRALEIRERVQGRDHPDLLAVYSGLAHTYTDAHEYGEAKAVLDRALANGEATHGPDHPDVATTIDGLGTIAFETGDLAAAERLFERALAIKENALGPNHPWVGASVGGLANVHDELGEHARALAGLERARAIFTAAFGPEHPEVSATLVNMGLIHAELGETWRAKLLFECALGIKLRTLAPDHPRLAGNYESLAIVLFELGEREKARRMLERALAIREKTLGEEHELVGATLVSLARIDDALGDHERAADDRTRADEILRKRGLIAVRTSNAR